jgi:excisionase family DNA binding protein
MNAMAFNKLLSRKEVIDAYQIPKDLEAEVFRHLRPVFGTGKGAKYQESLVDQQLHHYGLKKLRLREPDTEFSHKEDSKMIALNQDSDPLVRIAECVERLIEAFAPKETAAAPEVRMHTPKEAAKVMRVNPQTVMKWCRDKKMGVKAGRKWLISPDEVDRYLRGVLLTKGPKAVAP